MLDLSDGLSTDLARLCAASGVGAVVHAAQLPCDDTTLDAALNGGEDFELLFTVRPAMAHLLPETIAGVRVACVGEILGPPEILLADESGTRHTLHSGGFVHFAG